MRLMLFRRLTCSHQGPPGRIASGLAALMWRGQVDHQQRLRVADNASPGHRAYVQVGWSDGEVGPSADESSHHSFPFEHRTIRTVNHQWPRQLVVVDGNGGRNSVGRSIGGQAVSNPGIHHNGQPVGRGRPRCGWEGSNQAEGDARVAVRAVAQCFIHQTPSPPRARLGTTPGNAQEEAHVQVCSVLPSKADCAYYMRNSFAIHFWTRQTFYCVPLEE